MNKLKLYGSPYCLNCMNLKRYLENNNVKFEYIDVIKNEEQQNYIIEKTQQIHIPVLEINDKDYIIGYDLEKIKQVI